MSLEEQITQLNQSVTTLTKILAAAVQSLGAPAPAPQTLTISTAPQPQMQQSLSAAINQQGFPPAPPSPPVVPAAVNQVATAPGLPGFLTPPGAPAAQMSLPGMGAPNVTPFPFPTAEQQQIAAQTSQNLPSLPPIPGAPEPTYDDVKAAFTALAGSGRSMETIQALLGRFGVTSAQQVPQDQYARLIANIQLLIQNPGAQP